MKLALCDVSNQFNKQLVSSTTIDEIQSFTLEMIKATVNCAFPNKINLMLARCLLPSSCVKQGKALDEFFGNILTNSVTFYET